MMLTEAEEVRRIKAAAESNIGPAPIKYAVSYQEIVTLCKALLEEQSHRLEDNEALQEVIKEREEERGENLKAVNAAMDTAAEIGKERDAARERNRLLREALEALCDEQNGPPLLRRKGNWAKAMAAAHAALEGAKESHP